jgi:hypothetical protein
VSRLLGRYDAPALARLFGEAGVVRALEERGFTDVGVVVESSGRALPHVALFGAKAGTRWRLLDAILIEAVATAEELGCLGSTLDRPLRLLVIAWLSEADPTREFTAERLRLPLQRHPGLGVLRRAFGVVVRMARELGKDAVANRPKFFHDAVIFHRSRLFLFLDGREQGRFEALARDLGGLSLADASLTFMGGGVRDAGGAVVAWQPGIQAFPISAAATAHFHSPEYAAAVARGFEGARFTWDAATLDRTRATLAERLPREPRLP